MRRAGKRGFRPLLSCVVRRQKMLGHDTPAPARQPHGKRGGKRRPAIVGVNDVGLAGFQPPRQCPRRAPVDQAALWDCQGREIFAPRCVFQLGWDGQASVTLTPAP